MECNTNDDWAKPPDLPSELLPPPSYKQEDAIGEVNIALVDTCKQLRQMLQTKTLECQNWQAMASQYFAYNPAWSMVLGEREQLQGMLISQEYAQEIMTKERNQLREECNELRELTKKQQLKIQQEKQKRKQLKTLVKNEKDIYVWKAKAEMATRERDKLRCLVQNVKQIICDVKEEKPMEDADKKPIDLYQKCFMHLKTILDPPETKTHKQALSIEDLNQDTVCLFVSAET